MNSILILYATIDGQTEKIAKDIATIISHHGFTVDVRDIEALPGEFSIERYDALIFGAPVRYGKYPKRIVKYLKANTARLGNKPTAFFSVCGAAASPKTQYQEEAEQYPLRLQRETEWVPGKVKVFAGAVKYTKYNFVTRFIMKKISEKTGRHTDTSRDWEYTDWEAVKRFAEQFLHDLNQRSAIKEGAYKKAV
ncbi:MAG: menaquinone-dependent protoporphyrinogen IX dehydrogenase [Gammaproteobacteria bacterium]|nr:menaquinone-dependent protoporphyrinogen IX dehydrogenase [Gammaproteobacteria bacterium]